MDTGTFNSSRPARSGKRTALRGILGVVALYAAFATAWILASDWLLAFLVSDPVLLTRLGTLKGWAFVAVTSLLLFAVMQRFARRRETPSHAEDLPESPRAWEAEESACRASRSVVRVFAALAVVILSLGVLGILHTANRQKSDAIAHLRTIASLKAGQIANWLGERRRDAELVRTASVFGEELKRWRQNGDPASRAKILNQLEDYRRILGYRSVTLLDGEATPLLSAGDARSVVAPALREAARRAAASGRVLFTDFYRQEGDGGRSHVQLDFVTPLGQGSGEHGLVVALQIDVEEFLFPYIQSWPVVSTSGETLLFRQDGEHVLFLNELRHHPDSALKLRVPLDNKELLAVQVVDGRAKVGQAVEGIDYRSVPSLGVVQAVAGSRWHLIAKADKDELYADARQEAFWIVLADALALFLAMIAGIALQQRRELNFSLAQRQSQAEKLRALQVLEAIAESSTDIIFAKDAAGRYLLFNREAAQVTGMAAAKVLGKDDGAVYPPAKAAAIMADDRAVMAGNRVKTDEEMLTTPAGSITLLATKGPLRDVQGQVVGVFGIARDISERKAAEEALRQSEQRWVMALDSAGHGVWDRNVANGKVYYSQRWKAMLGYGDAEIGDDLAEWRSRMHPDDAAACDADLERHFRGETASYRSEHRLRCKDGSYKWILAQGMVVARDEAGRALRLIGTHTDITGQKEIELELAGYRDHLEDLVARRTREVAELNVQLEQRAVEAEAANRAKSAFLANMSHEIRTPMNAILGFTHLLRRQGANPEQRDKLEKIAVAAEHLLEIINGILDLSKIEAGKLTLEELDFNLADILGDALALVAEKAASRGLQLRQAIAPDLVAGGRLRGDPTRLKQILLNYLANAVKFTERGSVTLGCRIAEESSGGVLLRFEVGDTGIGIGAEDRRRLFSAFEQADNSTTRRFGGTGLGLAISKQLAALMGGEVGCESQPGLGSTFWFTARLQRSGTGPVEVVAPCAGGTASEFEGRLAGGYQGLTEDNPLCRSVLAQLVSLTAEDSFSAQKVFRDNLPLLRSVVEPGRLTELERHFAAFDYTRALAILREVQAEQSAS